MEMSKPSSNFYSNLKNKITVLFNTIDNVDFSNVTNFIVTDLIKNCSCYDMCNVLIDNESTLPIIESSEKFDTNENIFKEIEKIDKIIEEIEESEDLIIEEIEESKDLIIEEIEDLIIEESENLIIEEIEESEESENLIIEESD